MDKKRIKTELLVHDLKTPIAIIEAGINSLMNNNGRDKVSVERQIKILTRMLRNVKIAKGLVNDILEVGRSSQGIVNNARLLVCELLTPPMVEVFDLTDNSVSDRINVFEDISSLSKSLSERGIMLNVSERVWGKEVYLDPRKIIQIFRNLLTNAIKYRKNTIDIHVDIRKNKSRGEILFISVRDDGEGIEKIYHRKIFENYFQIESEREDCLRGHGLGLAGILILIEDMGGRMYLESGEGEGAKFSVILPLGVCSIC
ncbi:MAG: sensor histidine kinase [Deltaproteobacteria bacterium]|nr:sensor histidine kinase [Deltaproteobacteria bacterium]